MDANATRTITAMEPQQRAKDRVSIFLDGEFALGVYADVAHTLCLGVGQRISEERLREIVRGETLAKARDRAYLLLSYRARSEHEVRERLTRAGFEADIVNEVITRLYDLNFLDDKDFAQRFVRHRMESRPVGRRALAWELRRKGLDAETVAEATEAVDDDVERAAARKAAQARMKKLTAMDGREARRRLAEFLQRRGFGWDTIKCVSDELLPPDDVG